MRIMRLPEEPGSASLSGGSTWSGSISVTGPDYRPWAECVGLNEGSLIVTVPLPERIEITFNDDPLSAAEIDLISLTLSAPLAIEQGAVVADEKPSEPDSPVKAHIDAVIGDLRTPGATTKTQRDTLRKECDAAEPKGENPLHRAIRR